MKVYFWFCIVAFTVNACTNAQNNTDKPIVTATDTVIIKDWIDFEYSRVVAFATVNPFPFPSQEQIVITNGDSIGIELNSEQLNRLTKMLGPDTFVVERNLSDTIAVSAPADCFNPRHNIFFYDKNNKLVQYILVCYECRGVQASKNSPQVSLEEFKNFFGSIGLKVFDAPHFHKAFYDSLVKLKRVKR